MNLRALFISLFVAWSLCTAILLGAAAVFLSRAAAIPALDTIVLIAIGVLLFICTGILFMLMDLWIVGPIRNISTAAAAFVATAAIPALPNYANAATELQSLATSIRLFAATATKVDTRDQALTDVKSDFIETAAHQFRTPLTGIRWALEGLQKENLTPNQRMLVDNAVQRSYDLVAIVGTLLDISSIESGKYVYNFAPADMDQLLAEVVNTFTPIAQKTLVTLSYTRPEEPFPPVVMDRERIKWVLNNLVDNAIKYTPAQGGVTLTVQTIGTTMLVRVKDTGIGIPLKDRGNIFERFFRSQDATAKATQGNGLGLYIARTIAADHHGDLSFEENKEGVGTTLP